MKKILIFLGLLVLLGGGVFVWWSKTPSSSPITSPQPEPAGQPENIEEPAATEEIEFETRNLETEVDENFTITLESNPTTGYQWEVNFEPEYLQLVDKKYIPPEEQQLVGAGGQETFTFLPLQSGETQITFLYKRRWEEKEIKRFVYEVIIH